MAAKVARLVSVLMAMAADYLTDGRWINADAARDVGILFSSVFGAKNTKHRVALKPAARHASFTTSVKNVFALRTEDEMIWPDASAVVALVAHDHPSWYRPEGKLPSCTVRLDGRLPKATADLTISVRTYRSDPEPALARFIDLVPKALAEWHMFVAHVFSIWQPGLLSKCSWKGV